MQYSRYFYRVGMSGEQVCYKRMFSNFSILLILLVVQSKEKYKQ